MPEYRYCGLGLRVDFSLPVLPNLQAGEVIDLDIRAGDVPEWLDEVASAQPGVWSRNAQEALWGLSRVGRFHIRDRGHGIVYQRATTVDNDTFILFLLEVLFPLAAALRGDFLLRAAAVYLPDGEVVAYAGPSAIGKSTEGALRLQAGASLIADGLLRLTVEGDGTVLAHPQAPWLTLWPDVLNSLGWQNRSLQSLCPELSARRMSTKVLSGPLPLTRIVALCSREQDAINAMAGLALNRMKVLQRLTAANVWIDQPALRRQHFLWGVAILNRCHWGTRMRTEVGSPAKVQAFA